MKNPDIFQVLRYVLREEKFGLHTEVLEER
jgi:hypothetical protein